MLLAMGLATSWSNSPATDLVMPALLVIGVSLALLVVVFFVAQRRLLADWLPYLACPYCGQFTPLVNYWQCVGGCGTGKPRHVLSPCPTCGTYNQGMVCAHEACGQRIIFDAAYNEFAIVNRANKYVTRYNPIFWASLLALLLSVFFAYLSLQADSIAFLFFFGLISLAAIVTMLIAKPKRLVSNPYYLEEPQQWIRRTIA